MATKPPFLLGYWRPWKESSNVFDSWLNYAKDVSLSHYTSNTIAEYGQDATEQQMTILNRGSGGSLNNPFNRMLDLQVEQQRVTNNLLKDIKELLKLPESEKERQRSIELGLKFFASAKKNGDLYKDALEELHKAESLMKQDHLVLAQLGMIYLYVPEYLNPKKAFDYLMSAAKYLSVESDPSAIRLAIFNMRGYEAEEIWGHEIGPMPVLTEDEQVGSIGEGGYVLLGEGPKYEAYVDWDALIDRIGPKVLNDMVSGSVALIFGVY